MFATVPFSVCGNTWAEKSLTPAIAPVAMNDAARKTPETASPIVKEKYSGTMMNGAMV